MAKPWHMVNPNIPTSGQKSELLSESSNFRPAERKLTVQRPRRSCQCSSFFGLSAAIAISRVVFPVFMCLLWLVPFFQASNDLQQVFFFCREYRSKIENHPA